MTGTLYSEESEALDNRQTTEEPFELYRFVLFTDFSLSAKTGPRQEVRGELPSTGVLPAVYQEINKDNTYCDTNISFGRCCFGVVRYQRRYQKRIPDRYPGERSKRKSCSNFLDCVGFLKDYSEAASGVYVMKHNAMAGCNLCSFRHSTENVAY